MGKIRTVRIPVVGEMIPRLDTRDGQRMQDCIFRKIRVPVTNAISVRAYPRPAFADSVLGAGSGAGTAVYLEVFTWEGSGLTGGSEIVSVAKNGSNSTVYRGIDSLGDITGFCTGVEETSISSGTKPVVCFTSSDNTGWYYPLDSGTGTKTFTADTTNTSAVLTNVSSTTGCYEGQALSGTGIPAGTRILSVNSGASQITMTAAATATNAGVTITREKIAKIIDADFPGNAGYTLAGTFVAMDQRLNVMTTDGYLWSSNTDGVAAWVASTKVPSAESQDGGVALARMQSLLVCFGNGSVEFFQNVGLESGSPFVTLKNAHIRIGAFSASGVVRAKNTIYWVGSGKEYGMGVFQLSGRDPKKISDFAADRYLFQNAANLILTYGVLEGSEFLFLSLDGSSVVHAYQLDLELWSLWSVFDVMDYGIRKCAISTGSGSLKCYAIGTSTGAAKIGVVYPTTSLNSRASAFTISFERSDFGFHGWKKMHAARVIGDGTSTNPTNMSLSFSDNDQSSYHTARTVNMAATTPILRRCGRFKRRAIKLHAPGVSPALGFDAIEVDIEDLK